MGKAEEIIKAFDPSQQNKLKRLKISLEDRLEMICALEKFLREHDVKL